MKHSRPSSRMDYPYLPIKSSKFSIFEDKDSKNAQKEGSTVESVVNPVSRGLTSSGALKQLNRTVTAPNVALPTGDQEKKFTSYRTPHSEASFRSDDSFSSKSEDTISLSSNSTIVSPKKSATVYSTINTSLDLLPLSIAKQFEPNTQYSHIGGLRGILSERKSIYDFPEYTSDILAYWLSYEKRVRARTWYMDKQPDISYKMRAILVDWLVEVGEEYAMNNETVFKAIGCLDRFLSKMKVTRCKLQLVGTAALFICSKFEEIQPPNIEDFVTITDNTYTKVQVVQMERIMLNVLDFDLLVPTTFDFVRAFCALLKLDSPSTSLAMYLSELSILDAERYLKYAPSIVATAAIAVARFTFQNRYWDSTLEKLTTHQLTDIHRCSQHLFTSFYDAPTTCHTAIFEKYKAVQFCCVSLCILPAKLPACF